MNIEELRAEIDRIDSEIIRLYGERLETAKLSVCTENGWRQRARSAATSRSIICRYRIPPGTGKC